MIYMKSLRWRHFGDVSVSRKVIDEMERIFEILKANVAKEDNERVKEIKRHIHATGNEEKISDLIKHAGVFCFQYSGFKTAIIDYSEELFILVNQKYSLPLEQLGLELLDDGLNFGENEDVDEGEYEIVQGCQMLGIINHVIDIGNNISSMEIIDACLGTDETTFDFSELNTIFFEKSAVFKIDQSRLEMVYEEDCHRIAVYCLACEQNWGTEGINESLQELSMLGSSRSIALSLLNAINSQLSEYSYLQLYQCFEYLFKLNQSFDISEKLCVSDKIAVKFACEYDLKISERDQLKSIISKYSSENEVDLFIKMSGISTNDSENVAQKKENVSNKIYDLRCGIAHLRYGQKKLYDTVKWGQLLESLVNMLVEIYQKIDQKIIDTCKTNNSWSEIQYDHS